MVGAVKPTVRIASVLLGPSGEIVGVYRKTVLWDYEHTLFEPSTDAADAARTRLPVVSGTSGSTASTDAPLSCAAAALR